MSLLSTPKNSSCLPGCQCPSLPGYKRPDLNLNRDEHPPKDAQDGRVTEVVLKQPSEWKQLVGLSVAIRPHLGVVNTDLGLIRLLTGYMAGRDEDEKKSSKNN